jgi:diadenylate cyclase
MIVLIIAISILSITLDLPAFSWLLRTTLPALLIAIPVIFAPEIRRALERLGRAGRLFPFTSQSDHVDHMIDIVCSTAQRLADRRFGALIVTERDVHLDEYAETGIRLDAHLTPELLLQVFYTNTPLHDGAVILRGTQVIAAACVMPLSSSGTLSSSPGQKMGLRHRAAIGISEVSDCVTVVVSEETGGICVTHNGRIIRRLDQNRLRNILTAFYRPRMDHRFPGWLNQLLTRVNQIRIRIERR